MCSKMWPVWFWVLGWLLTVITVAGNGLVIYLITSRQKLRTTANWFILSLAMADFGYGVTYFPLSTACNINQLCANGLIRQSMAIFFVYASITNICALTFDRCVAIIKPLRYITFMTEKRVVFLISVTWALPLLLFLVPYLTWQLATTGKPDEVLVKCFWGILSVLQVCACVTLVFATARIFLIAWRHKKQTATLLAQLGFNYRMPQHSRASVRSHEATSTKVIGIVVPVFVICHSVEIYHNTCNYFQLCADSTARLYLIVLFMLSNSAVNPLVYALFKKDIKKELKRMFFCFRETMR